VVFRSVGWNSSAKLGRFNAPLDFFSNQIGDFGKNGRVRMRGIAGISPDSRV
jgi:hypothetical protein